MYHFTVFMLFYTIRFIDNIALSEDHIVAQELLIEDEKACQEGGLFLNAPNTKYMHLNPSSESKLHFSGGFEIDLVGR